MLDTPRCLLIFEESIKSEHTKRTYTLALKQFLRWTKLDSYDDLLQADEKSIHRLLEDYIIHLKGKLSPNTLNTELAPIFLFYQMNDVNINKIRLKKMFPATVKRSGYNAYSHDNIQKMLKATKSKRTRASILILASTGCRSGALIDLKIQDIENYKDDCKIVTFYSRDKSEYYGFLTPEASDAVDDYLEQRIQDHERIEPYSPMIRENYRLGSIPPRKITRQMLASLIEMTLKEVKRTKDSSGRNNISITNGFRKFFNSLLKLRENVNLSICEKLMGHSVTIDLDNHYLKVPKESLFGEFKKIIPELIIDDSERLRVENDLKEKEIQELKSEKRIISELETRIQSVESLLQRVNAKGRVSSSHSKKAFQ